MDTTNHEWIQSPDLIKTLTDLELEAEPLHQTISAEIFLCKPIGYPSNYSSDLWFVKRFITTVDIATAECLRDMNGAVNANINVRALTDPLSSIPVLMFHLPDINLNGNVDITNNTDTKDTQDNKNIMNITTILSKKLLLSEFSTIYDITTSNAIPTYNTTTLATTTITPATTIITGDTEGIILQDEKTKTQEEFVETKISDEKNEETSFMYALHTLKQSALSLISSAAQSVSANGLAYLQRVDPITVLTTVPTPINTFTSSTLSSSIPLTISQTDHPEIALSKTTSMINSIDNDRDKSDKVDDLLFDYKTNITKGSLWLITPYYASSTPLPAELVRHCPTFRDIASSSSIAVLTGARYDCLTQTVVIFIIHYLRLVESRHHCTPTNDISEDELIDVIKSDVKIICDGFIRIVNACDVLGLERLLNATRLFFIQRLRSASSVEEFRLQNKVLSFGGDRKGERKWFDKQEWQHVMEERVWEINWGSKWTDSDSDSDSVDILQNNTDKPEKKECAEDYLVRSRDANHFGMRCQKPDFSSASDAAVDCSDCGQQFRLGWRLQYHCKHCGLIFCGACSQLWQSREDNKDDSSLSSTDADGKININSDSNDNGSSTPALLLTKLFARDWSAAPVCKRCYMKYELRYQFCTRAFRSLLLPLPVLKIATSINAEWRVTAGCCLFDFFQIQYRRPTRRFTHWERQMLWINRRWLLGHGPWMRQLIHATDWNDVESAQEVLSLLNNGFYFNKSTHNCLHITQNMSCLDVMCSRECRKMLPVELGIDILRTFSRPRLLQSFAVDCIRTATKEQLDCILPELIEALSNETLLDLEYSPLMHFLLSLSTHIHIPIPWYSSSFFSGSCSSCSTNKEKDKDEKQEQKDEIQSKTTGFINNKFSKSVVIEALRDPNFITETGRIIHAPPPDLSSDHFALELYNGIKLIAISAEGVNKYQQRTIYECALELLTTHIQKHKTNSSSFTITRNLLIEGFMALSQGDRCYLEAINIRLARRMLSISLPFDANKFINHFDIQDTEIMNSAAAPVRIGIKLHNTTTAININKEEEEPVDAHLQQHTKIELPILGDMNMEVQLRSDEWVNVTEQEKKKKEEDDFMEEMEMIGQTKKEKKEKKKQEKERKVEMNDMSIMFKKDDLRKDDVVLRMVRWMNGIWAREGLPINLLTYRVNAISPTCGFIQMVWKASTLFEITECSKKDTSILAHLIRHNPHDAIGAQVRFIRSLAGWNAVTMLLGVGDRHQDNFLITESADFFNIDFGWLVAGPKPIEPRARLDSHMIEALGGEKSPEYAAYLELCLDAALALRPHLPTFLRMMSLCCSSNPPISQWNLTHEELDNELCQRFLPGYTDAQAREVYLRWMKMDAVSRAAVSIWDFTHRIRRQGGLVSSVCSVLRDFAYNVGV